jgi:NAD(P)-dependent dehydrogenase (short-subunit alcohol dehydrogenase family)
MKNIIITFILLFIYQSSSAQKNSITKPIISNQKAVLVTGASSGIGRNIAETLAKKGYFVYAGARKQKDLDALNAINNIQAIKLDVTILSEIDAAVKTVKQAGRGLYGIVNNAGVTVFGPLIEVSEKDMQFQMDVNLFGPYRINKAFAPLIIKSKGRISTIGSIAGITSGQLLGPYSMSKYAMEAYTDALYAEMKKFGVHVSIVEPGNYNSKVIINMQNRIKKNNSYLKDSKYKQEMQGLEQFLPTDRTIFKNPDDVSAAILHALFSDKPKRHYMVVPVQGEAEFTIQIALNTIVELNRGHTFSYGKATLMSMLEKAIDASVK